jgi:hypothetical protein
MEGRSRRGSVAVLKTEGTERYGVRIYPPSANLTQRQAPGADKAHNLVPKGKVCSIQTSATNYG